MKAKLVGLVLLGIVVISVISVISILGPIDVSPQKKQDDFKDWNRVDAFAVNKKEYKIGENVFFVAIGLEPTDVGNATFVMPNGQKNYLSIPFDGSLKSSFNYYFKPSLSKARQVCSTDQIIGDWTIVFEGSRYQPVKFTILNETISTEIGIFQRVC